MTNTSDNRLNIRLVSVSTSPPALLVSVSRYSASSSPAASSSSSTSSSNSSFSSSDLSSSSSHSFSSAALSEIRKYVKTSRERPKSAPYLCSKIAKGLQNVKVLVNLEPFMKTNFEKSRTVPKKSKGGTLRSRPVLYVTRETFLVQFFGPTGIIWRLLEIL